MTTRQSRLRPRGGPVAHGPADRLGWRRTGRARVAGPAPVDLALAVLAVLAAAVEAAGSEPCSQPWPAPHPAARTRNPRQQPAARAARAGRASRNARCVNRFI